MANWLCRTLIAALLYLPSAVSEQEFRHNANNQPSELNVDASSTYNDKFMALMQSPCRPEYDGYFGATYGEPVKITYAFHLETQPLSAIVDLLDVIEDKVVDEILANSFPQICGFGRRRLSHASGFRFLKLQEVEACDPKENALNFCGVFSGQINVYGHDEDKATVQVLGLLDRVLNPSDPTKLHPDLVDMSSVEKYLEISGGNVDLEDGVDVRALGWAGMALVMVIFLAAFWWFFIRNEKQGDTAFSNKDRNKGKWNRYFMQHQRRMEYDPEEKSIKPSFEPEAESFGGGETFLLRTDEQNREVGSDSFEQSTVSGHII